MMPGMTAPETTSCIAHHLNIVGRPDQLFTEDALNLIHTTAGAIRAVNNLALQSLVAAFASGKNLVDDAAARSAVTEVVDSHHRHLAGNDRHLTDETPPQHHSAGFSRPARSALTTPHPSASSTHRLLRTWCLSPGVRPVLDDLAVVVEAENVDTCVLLIRPG
jgi:hypothetical protein